MKNAKILTLAIMMISLFMSASAKPAGEEKGEVISTIRNAMSFPSFVNENEEIKTQVLFTISPEGKIEVQDVITSDEKLKAHIISCLEGIPASRLKGVQGTFSTNITFRQQ